MMQSEYHGAARQEKQCLKKGEYRKISKEEAKKLNCQWFKSKKCGEVFETVDDQVAYCQSMSLEEKRHECKKDKK